MKADPTTEAAVKAVLNQIGEAYAKRDIALLQAICAPDADVLMYGTGADEKRIGWSGIKAQAERDWSQTEASAMKMDWISVSSAGPVAWVAADGSFELTAGGQEMSLPARITMTLEQRGDKWLMVQSHFSFPAPNQEAGESFPA